MKVRVVGLKVWIGTVDGKSIESGKAFCEVKLDDRRNSDKQWAAGVATEEYRCDPDILQRCKHLPLPFEADLVVERFSNGKETREVVLDLVPMGFQTVSKPAAVKAA